MCGKLGLGSGGQPGNGNGPSSECLCVVVTGGKTKELWCWKDPLGGRGYCQVVLRQEGELGVRDPQIAAVGRAPGCSPGTRSQVSSPS